MQLIREIEGVWFEEYGSVFLGPFAWTLPTNPAQACYQVGKEH